MFSYSSTMSTITDLLSQVDRQFVKKSVIVVAWYFLASPLFEIVQNAILTIMAAVVTFFTVPVPMATSTFPLMRTIRIFLFGAAPVAKQQSPFAELVETYVPFMRTTGVSVDDVLLKVYRILSYIPSFFIPSTPAVHSANLVHPAMAGAADLFEAVTISVYLALACLAVIGIAVAWKTISKGLVVQEGFMDLSWRERMERVERCVQRQKRAVVYSMVEFLGSDLFHAILLLSLKQWTNSQFDIPIIALSMASFGSSSFQDFCKDWVEGHVEWGPRPTQAAAATILDEMRREGNLDLEEIDEEIEYVMKHIALFDIKYGDKLKDKHLLVHRRHHQERLKYLRMHLYVGEYHPQQQNNPQAPPDRAAQGPPVALLPEAGNGLE